MPAPRDGARHYSGARRRTPASRAAIRSIQVVLALVSLAILVGAGWGWHAYRALDESVESVSIPILHSQSGPSAARTGGFTSDINILLVGDDSRVGLSHSQTVTLHTGTSDTNGTDTMMIMHIPAGGKRATIVSLPRDGYVHIGHGWIDNKLNAAFSEEYQQVLDDGGTTQQAETKAADLLIETVQNLTGVKINRYVQVGFNGFEKVADVVGVMPVTLCKSVDDANSGFKMSAGHHTMNPVQMLEFVRQRDNLPGGDLAREARQQYFLTQAFKEVMTLHVLTNPAALNRLVNIVKSSFIIDGFPSLSQFADEMSSLSSGNITGHTIPTMPGPNIPRVGSVLLVNKAKVQAFIHGLFFPASAPRPSVSGVPATATPRTTPLAPSQAGGTATRPPAERCVN